MVKTESLALCNEAAPYDCARCFADIAPTEFFLRRTFIKAHFDKVDLFIAPSHFLRWRYVEWGIPEWQIVVLENGARPVEPPPPRPLAEGERRSVFGFFGQINPYKGLLQLLTAFDHVSRFPAELSNGVRLVVNGAYLEGNDPAFRTAFAGLMAKSPGRVHFAGPYKAGELYRLMAEVDWVVVPSIWWENSPLVIQEALAHRRPVLCSDIGGMAEKVRWGQDGFHFPVGNAVELAKLLVQVCADQTIWDKLQQTMRAPVTLDETVARHLQLYRDDSFALAH
jgi:glycosyltransferase involved in cell wall biosynthesis